MGQPRMPDGSCQPPDACLPAFPDVTGGQHWCRYSKFSEIAASRVFSARAELPGVSSPVCPDPDPYRRLDHNLLLGLYVFVLAAFVGYEVIARVPATLHTPLMSATNAIHGVVLLGAILVAGAAHTPVGHVLGFFALVLAAANVFGGFAVTERMLNLFRNDHPRKQ